jgi:hypothetical protein
MGIVYGADDHCAVEVMAEWRCHWSSSGREAYCYAAECVLQCAALLVVLHAATGLLLFLTVGALPPPDLTLLRPPPITTTPSLLRHHYYRHYTPSVRAPSIAPGGRSKHVHE